MDHIDRYTTTVGERGRVVLPARLRQELNLRPGDRLVLTRDAAGGFTAMPARALAGRLRGLYRDFAPGCSLAEELATERRDEARRDEG